MASGSDEKISGTKITPLDSEVKYGVEHDISNRGAVGSDTNIDKSRANPVGGSGMNFMRLIASVIQPDPFL